MDVLQSQKTLTTLADGHGVIDDVGVIFSTILNHQQPIRKEIKAFVSNYEVRALCASQGAQPCPPPPPPPPPPPWQGRHSALRRGHAFVCC